MALKKISVLTDCELVLEEMSTLYDERYCPGEFGHIHKHTDFTVIF